MTDGQNSPFWQTKSLADMSRGEWESLCDGCAKCCLIKLQDVDAGTTEYTDVACRLLDHDTCRCSRYATRREEVPDCVTLTADTIAALQWMPSTCAYRLLAEGRPLYWWHPLVSGDPETVHLAGISVRHRILSESEVDDDTLEDRVVDWPR